MFCFCKDINTFKNCPIIPNKNVSLLRKRLLIIHQKIIIKIKLLTYYIFFKSMEHFKNFFIVG